MIRQPLLRLTLASLCAVLGACATVPPAAPVRQPVLGFEDKMGWILRLEEDRILEIPAPADPAPPAIPPPGRGRASVPAAAPPRPPRPSLPTLLEDEEPRIRWRAALAAGRTRVPAGVTPLAEVLASDPDPEVRQVSAFALGLIGDASAADALVKALADAEPLVQGRAAEALGLIGHKPAADAVAAMMAVHVKAGALSGILPDDLEHPKPPPVEAVRLGAYSLVRLNAAPQLLSVLSDGSGRPISSWWPVAYAFRRVADPSAGPVLLTLLKGPGTFSREFAARGLGAIKEQAAVPALVALVSNDSEMTTVRIEAIRALAEIRADEAVEPLRRIVMRPTLDPNLRLEAVTALGRLAAEAAVDLFVDLLPDSWPSMRAAALTALAQTDASVLLTVISGLDPDPHWSVRAALARALGTLEAAQAMPRLTMMLNDSDQRVIPAVLEAVAAVSAPDAASILTGRLDGDDPVVRMAAAQGLARLKAVTAVPALTAAYDRAEKDPTYVARAAILAAVADLDRAAARPLLARALADRDWAIRVRAASLLRTVDPAADVSAMRPAPPVPLPELNDLPALINPQVSPTAYIETDKGQIQIELAVLDAPRTVANFISLARRNFLGGTPFHRVVPAFVVQDGDPRGDGDGGPGYTIRDEINQRPYLRGTVGMALDWEDTGGSQFFITVSPQPHLDGRYPVFGRVIAGMDVVDRLTQWDQVRSVRIWDGVNWIGGP